MTGRDPLAFLEGGGVTALKGVGIHIGQCHVAKAPTVICTLLGSCVAACLYDPAKRMGGMNHILLPGRGDGTDQRDLARFGLDAMERLIHQLDRAGASRKRLVAKVFGGAHVLRHLDERSSPGFRNGRFIVDFLEAERIPVVSSDLGGYHARKIYFRTDTGEVLLRRVRVPEVSAVVDEEKRFRHQVLGKLHHATPSGKHAGARGAVAGRRPAREVT